MTILYKNKDSLILDMIDTVRLTKEYLIDMQKQYGEDHADEIHALESMLKRYKAEFKTLTKGTKQ